MLVPPWAGSSQPVGPLKAASLGEEPSNKLVLMLNSHLAAASLESSLPQHDPRAHSHVEKRGKKFTFIKCDSFFLFFSCSSEEPQRIGFQMPQRPTAVLVNADVYKNLQIFPAWCYVKV